MTFRTRIAHSLLFAATLALAFPFRAGELRFDLGAAAGWLALAPLAALLRDLGPRAAFKWTFFSSWLGFTLILFWLYVVVTVHGGAPAIAGVAAVLVVSGVFAVHAGAAGALWVWLAPRAGRAAALVLPAAWLVMEHLRGFDFLGGFTWASLGYSAHLDLPMLGLASIGGVHALSLATALAGTLLGLGRWPAALAVFAVAHGIGFLALPSASDLAAPRDPPLRVAMVQGNIPQGEKWDPARAQRNFGVHLELSRAVAVEKPDLILWPESALPGFLEAQPEFRDPLLALASELDVPLVVGGIGLSRVPGERMPLRARRKSASASRSRSTPSPRTSPVGVKTSRACSSLSMPARVSRRACASSTAARTPHTTTTNATTPSTKRRRCGGRGARGIVTAIGQS